jgi:hypothetical protein
VRRDCDLRMERLSATAAGAESADELIGALGASLLEMMDESPEFFVILLELHSLGQHNAEVAVELAELHRRVRVHLAGILAAARDQGAVRLEDDPEIVAEVLFSIADGLAMRMLAEPAREFGPTVEVAVRAARALVLPV